MLVLLPRTADGVISASRMGSEQVLLGRVSFHRCGLSAIRCRGAKSGVGEEKLEGKTPASVNAVLSMRVLYACGL